MQHFGADAANHLGWPANTYGTTWPKVEVGLNPIYNDGSPLIGSNDDGVDFFNGRDYFQHAAAGTYDISTEDFVFELIAEYVNDNFHWLYVKKATYGIDLEFDSTTDTFKTRYFGTGGALGFNSSSALLSETVNHLMIFYDASGSVSMYRNGAAFATPGVVSSLGDLTSAAKATLGAFTDGSLGFNSRISVIRAWKQASWLDTHLQGAVATSRFQRITGLIAARYLGTSTPTVATRASAGSTTKVLGGSPQLFFVSANWIPTIYDDSTSAYMMSNPAETNEILQSSTLNTTWSVNGTATVVEATGEVTDPKGDHKASKVTGVAIGANHIEQPLAAATFSNDAKLAVSFWIYRISTSGLLEIVNAQDDISPHDLGHWVIDMADLPDAWVRIDRSSPYIDTSEEFVEFVAAADGSAGMHFHRESGGGTLEFYMYNVQQIQNGEYHTYGEIIPTLAAASTRAADSVYWKLDDGNLGGVGSDKKGTIKFIVGCRCGNTGWAIQVAQTLLEISDGGASADRLNIQVNTSNYAQVVIDATGGTTRTAVGPEIDIMDGSEHSIQVSYRPGRVVVYVDGKAGTPINTPVAADIPDELDRATLGLHPLRKLELHRRPVWSARKFTR
jgi:hypothetical protein